MMIVSLDLSRVSHLTLGGNTAVLYRGVTFQGHPPINFTSTVANANTRQDRGLHSYRVEVRMTHRNKTKTNVNAFQIRNKTNTIPCHCTLLRTFSEKPTLTVQKISLRTFWNWVKNIDLQSQTCIVDSFHNSQTRLVTNGNFKTLETIFIKISKICSANKTRLTC